MSGIVVVDKPGGLTSHDVVNRIRRLYGTRRVGHTGTLDPLATGVLVVCLGRATRVVEYLTAARKEYVAGILFGVTTDTEDVSGHLITETDASALTEADVRAILPRFRGRMSQTPPMVSAVHHEGKRLHELARQGIEVERQPRVVEVYRLEMTAFAPGPRASATFIVECSTGTYIRTLAADIGAALGVGGTMASLRRTRVGAFTLADAHALEDLAARKEAGTLAQTLRSVADALADWPRAMLDAEGLQRLAHGQPIRRPVGRSGHPPLSEGPGQKEGLILLVDAQGEAVGIAREEGRALAPVKVFIQPE